MKRCPSKRVCAVGPVTQARIREDGAWVGALLIATLVTAPLAGCERGAPKQTGLQADTRLVADVVARVGGRPIGATEVEARMQSDGLSADDALGRLIDEELLVQEAERRGLVESPETERMIERLMVRAMLHDLENENTPESVTEQELRNDYALHADKFHIRERRRSWHILVKQADEAGRKRAQAILREIQRAENPRLVFERYAEAGSDDSGLEVKAEDLPELTQQANIESPYKDALFAAKGEGPLSDVVKTSYGWHAIVVAEILREETRTLADVEAESRERLSQRNRLAKLVEIVEGLEAEGLVEYEEATVTRLLSTPHLPERASSAAAAR